MDSKINVKLNPALYYITTAHTNSCTTCILFKELYAYSLVWF